MTRLSGAEKTVFIGYNVLYGSKVYHTLDNVSHRSCIEMPVAENLMTGVAIGMCMAGWKPVLIFERHDFMWLAMDQLVNHLNALGHFRVPLIIRAIVGSTKPLDPGPQHRADYTDVFKKVFDFPVIEVRSKEDVDKYLIPSTEPRLFVEWREIYSRQTTRGGRKGPPQGSSR